MAPRSAPIVCTRSRTGPKRLSSPRTMTARTVTATENAESEDPGTSHSVVPSVCQGRNDSRTRRADAATTTRSSPTRVPMAIGRRWPLAGVLSGPRGVRDESSAIVPMVSNETFLMIVSAPTVRYLPLPKQAQETRRPFMTFRRTAPVNTANTVTLSPNVRTGTTPLKSIAPSASSRTGSKKATDRANLGERPVNASTSALSERRSRTFANPAKKKVTPSTRLAAKRATDDLLRQDRPSL